MAILLVSIAILGKFCVVKTGLLFGKPDTFYLETLFAPIYEEIIFRAVILSVLLKHYSLVKAVVFSSLLFGLWHIKNIFFVDPFELLKQICYTGIIFGPIMCLITYKTKTIWIATIIHYLNNGISFLLLYSSII
ncbi:MAG: CPBP family intramembrane metalloprotease [Paludibacter sp.]|nr:CPBP family intramembrane metalloprotease [Paludibacter sp.]